MFTCYNNFFNELYVSYYAYLCFIIMRPSIFLLNVNMLYYFLIIKYIVSKNKYYTPKVIAARRSNFKNRSDSLQYGHELGISW